MKKSVLKIGLFSMVLLGIVSCKNKEKELAEQRITELEIYVDSLKAANADELEANWDKIQMDFDRKNDEIAVLQQMMTDKRAGIMSEMSDAISYPLSLRRQHRR